MNIRTLSTLFAIILTIPFASSQAQDTFAPDRPGLGNGTYVLHPKITYLETGLEYYEGGKIDQFSFGQVLFRHGLIEGMELRVQVNSFIIERRPVDNESGVPDPGLGVKFDLVNRPASGFSLSGLTSVTIPAGYSTFSDDKWHPSGTLLADYQLSQYWSLGSNFGYTAGPGYTSDLVTVTLTPGFSVPNSDYGGYFGYAGFITESDNQHFLEAGLTKRVAQSLQLDINTGYDLNSGDSFVGVGLALQF